MRVRLLDASPLMNDSKVNMNESKQDIQDSNDFWKEEQTSAHL